MVCPACGGIGFIMGILGKLVWFRCRACGMDFCKKNKYWEKKGEK